MNCQHIKEIVTIREVLASFNRFPARENNRCAFYFALDRDEKIPSLSVDFIKNKAFDFGNGKSYDVISIVQQIKKCNVSDALKYLKKFNFYSAESCQSPAVSKGKSYQIEKVGDIKHPALIQYLKSRKVLEQNDLLREIHYLLNDKKCFGLGFANNSGGFEIRNKFSKICLGQKDVTLIRNEITAKTEIVVFEGFMDYLTYRNITASEDLAADHLILNSTAMLFKAFDILKTYHKISLFLDNDPNGRATKGIIAEKFDNVEDCSLIYSEYKDLNEWFCNRYTSL